MEKNTVHDKAIRLLEGGIVEIDANWFRLKRFSDDYDSNTCEECNLDSICLLEHTAICSECEAMSNVRCCLQLASESR